jgi:hypothetical protein
VQQRADVVIVISDQNLAHRLFPPRSDALVVWFQTADQALVQYYTTCADATVKRKAERLSTSP